MNPPVEAPTSSARRPENVDPQRVERVGELDAAAGDERRGRLDVELHVGGHELAGLGGAGAAGHVDLPGDHSGGRPRAGREEPTLRQQAVEADPGHGATR